MILGPLEAPTIYVPFFQKLNGSKSPVVVKLANENHTALEDRIKEILYRNEKIIEDEKIRDARIKQLLLETKEAAETSKPTTVILTNWWQEFSYYYVSSWPSGFSTAG